MFLFNILGMDLIEVDRVFVYALILTRCRVGWLLHIFFFFVSFWHNNNKSEYSGGVLCTACAAFICCCISKDSSNNNRCSSGIKRSGSMLFFVFVFF